MWCMRRYNWSNQISRRSLDNLTTFTSIWKQLVQSCFYPVSHLRDVSSQVPGDPICFWSRSNSIAGCHILGFGFGFRQKKVAAFVKSKVDVAALLLHFTTSKESNLVAAAGCKNKIYFKIISKLYQTSRFRNFPFFGRYEIRFKQKSYMDKKLVSKKFGIWKVSDLV